MSILDIDITDRYLFSKIEQAKDENIAFKVADMLVTTCIHEGNASLEIDVNGEFQQIKLKDGEGFVVTPGCEYRLITEGNFTAFQVSSEVKPDSSIIEIIDDGHKKREAKLEGYKIIKTPKVVKKPWGHELWFIWTKNHHVLKQIGMKAGNKSSLQFHREKLETNFLVEGEADITTGCILDRNLPEEKLKEIATRINLDEYKRKMLPGMKWTSCPGDVHRVYAVKDYIAYEVSTPELDDVIRLQDDARRNSGRIRSEHRY